MHVLQHTFLGYWQVPWILLPTALIVMIYGRYENQRLEGSALLSLSAYTASAALSLVALIYVLILPVRLVMRHLPWNSGDVMDWVILSVCAVALAWVSGTGIRQSSGDL